MVVQKFIHLAKCNVSWVISC